MKVAIVGIGIHPFGRTPGVSGRAQGARAARVALADAGIEWADVQFAFGGSHAAGGADSLVSDLGLTGVPFINVANGCGTGGSALIAARSAILSGEHDLGLVVGFDKHPPGAIDTDPASLGLGDWYGETGLMLTTQFFAMKIQRYLHQHGISTDTLAAVAAKAYRNGSLNPNAWRREPHSAEAVATSRMISHPLTQYMFCSPAEGGAALILASDRKMRELGLTGPKLRGAAVRTRVNGSFEVFSPSLDVERGPSPTQLASKACYEMAGVGPGDIDVAQLQDTESGAEIMHMAENGFCADGEQERMLAEGATRLGGALPVNTDGGCLACGEPIGASGLRQVYENVQQLRGRAEGRQVEGARLGYSQVYGAPGLSGVVILEA